MVPVKRCLLIKSSGYLKEDGRCFLSYENLMLSVVGSETPMAIELNKKLPLVVNGLAVWQLQADAKKRANNMSKDSLFYCDDSD